MVSDRADRAARLLAETGVVHVAPMAGGPTTPRLVAAAANNGHFAQLAGGYRTTADLAQQITATRELIEANAWFGVNLFAPNPVPISQADYDTYAATLRPLAAQLGVTELLPRREDDDEWAAKIDLLIDQPVPVVSFTFGIPEPGVIARFRQVGSVIVQTVTTPDEAVQAAAAGVDMLVVQAASAGGHSATLTPATPVPDTPLPTLVADVRAVTNLPIIAAGGIESSSDVAAALNAGAGAAMIGTLALLSDEAGTSDTHRRALTNAEFTATEITRAYTGRPARGLANTFITEHADAPAGYPALHYLTRPIRMAAAAADDPHHLHLWAGTAWKNAQAQPITDILRDLTPHPWDCLGVSNKRSVGSGGFHQ